MERIDKVIEIANSSHHMPFLLSLLLGLCLVKRNSDLSEDDLEVTGDNVPATLMDGFNI